MKTPCIIGIIIFWIAASIVGCGGNENPLGAIQVKLGHVLPTEHPSAVAVEKFAKLVNEKTHGAIEVTVYPSGQLGQEKDLAEQVQMGSLKAARLSASLLEVFVPEMRVHSLPYLYRDDEHKRKIFEGAIGKEILEAGASKNIMGILYFDSGYRSFYTQKPIRKPEDLAGIRCRAQNSPMMKDVIKYLGASPQVVNWNELYTALSQGVVDAAENNISTLYYARHYEICKYYNLTEHVGTPDVIVFNTTFWNNTLTAEQRDQIREAAGEAVALHWDNWQVQCAKQLKEMREKGVTISTLDKTPFVNAVQPIYDQIKGTKLGDLAARIKAVR
ncbi:MAG: TRAP transporter substrate-binding protein [Planctomycetota bacterium]|nr:MAG: TRAP transporter substrate-binding protein [Planctomycetota bacterium]